MSISHKRPSVLNRGRSRTARPKTFKSEESAKKYAEANKIANYRLEPVRQGLSKKLRIVQG